MEKCCYNQLINNQMDWLSTLITPNGEFIMHDKPSNNSYSINPYFANISCKTLLSNNKYFNKVIKYLNWYIKHLNFPDKFGINGTIYDYKLKTNGELVSTNDYDSYDSYPATFLSLCKEYIIKTNDTNFFHTNKSKIDAITNSLITSMDEDYLTWAKPNYKIKCLMDNCEVNQGLKNAVFIYNEIYNDISFAEELNTLYQKNTLSIENKLWNQSGYYYFQIDEHDKKYEPDLNNWYPDSSSQLYPILYNIISSHSNRAQSIYNKFNNYNPNWFNENKKGQFPNTYVGCVALLMNDYNNALKFIDFCIENYIKKDNKWPWNCFESSYFIKTLKLLYNNL